MKSLIVSLAGVLLLFDLAVFGQTTRELDRDKRAVPVPAEKRIALVIGNGLYTNAPPLRNPASDARDMAATLKLLGFDVTSGINTTQREMKRLIREFGLKLKAGGSGLFYYAGHGVQSKGRNYLIPVDADIQSEAEIEDSGVDVGLVLNFMDDAQNGLNIVILDACRNNPFASSSRSSGGGLAQVDAPTGTLIAYATAPGTVASDGPGQNGLYTSELLKQMRTSNQSATEMFMSVRAEVMKKTANKQVPWEASSLVGAFYFSAPPKVAGPANQINPTESTFDSGAFELSYWETIKLSTNVADFKAYLQKYPEGQFVSLAQNRVNSLEPPSKPAESKPTPTDNGAIELAFWDSIKASASADDYNAYLKKYPNGSFAELAAGRVRSLESAQAEKEKKAIEAATPKIEPPKEFRVTNGKSYFGAKGNLFISAAEIRFAEKNNDAKKNWALPCSGVTDAKVPGFPADGSYFLIKFGEQTEHFIAKGGDAADEAVAAVRSACKLAPKVKKN